MYLQRFKNNLFTFSFCESHWLFTNYMLAMFKSFYCMFCMNAVISEKSGSASSGAPMSDLSAARSAVM